MTSPITITRVSSVQFAVVVRFTCHVVRAVLVEIAPRLGPTLTFRRVTPIAITPASFLVASDFFGDPAPGLRASEVTLDVAVVAGMSEQHGVDVGVGQRGASTTGGQGEGVDG